MLVLSGKVRLRTNINQIFVFNDGSVVNPITITGDIYLYPILWDTENTIIDINNQ